MDAHIDIVDVEDMHVITVVVAEGQVDRLASISAEVQRAGGGVVCGQGGVP